MRLMVLLAGWLMLASPVVAQTTVLARGDFDGDGREDILESAPLAEIAGRLDGFKPLAGSPGLTVLVRDMTKRGGAIAVAAELAARPGTAFNLALMDGDIKAEVLPAGRYAFETPVDSVLGPMVRTTQGDIIVLSGLRGGRPLLSAMVWEEGRFVSRTLLGPR